MSGELVTWAIRFSVTSYVVRVTCAATTTDLRFPATGTDLDPDTDYFISGDGSSTDLLKILENAIEAHTQVTTCAVTINSGLTVNVASSPNAATLEWSHANTTLDATIYGYENDTDSGPGTSLNGPNIADGIWYPRRSLARDPDDAPKPISSVVRSLSGRTYANVLVTAANAYPERQLLWQHVLPRYTRPSEADATEPLNTSERWWTESLVYGRPFRVHDDVADLTVSYRQYEPVMVSDPITRNPQREYYYDCGLQAVRTAEVA